MSANRIIALFLVTLMLVQLPYGLADNTTIQPSRGSRALITTFDAGATNVTYSYLGDQVVRTSSFMLPNNAYVDQATLHVRPLPKTPGTKVYPDRPQVDVGDDGGIDWRFDHQGFGKFGYQSVLYNDSVAATLDLKANIKDNSTAIRLPLKANVTSATLNIQGDFKMAKKFSLEGNEGAAYLGRALNFVGDLNNDGWPDFAVGIPRNDSNGHSDNGRVLVFFGGASLDSTPDLILNGTGDGDEFGGTVSPAGDLNKDGYDDLLIGAPSYSGGAGMRQGRAYIYFGGSPMDGTFDLSMYGEGPGDWFSFAAMGVGDLNKDGYDDIVITSPNWRNPDIYGKAYVYLGGASMDNVSDLIIQGPQIAQYWGRAVSPAGDVNKDGYDDFLVGTEISDKACVKCGRADLFYGGSPLNGVIDLSFYGTGGEELGYAMATLGDLNKDGYDDFAISAIRNDLHGILTGAVYVYFGGAPADNVADLKIFGTGGGEYFGSSLSSAGDMNNDGWLDIAIGSMFNNTGKADSGAVYILFGGSPLHNTTDLKIPGTGDSDQFGSAISAGVDIDKDGYPDLLVGAPFNDSKAIDGGQAYLYTTVPKRAVDPVLTIDGLSGNPGKIWNATGVYIGNKTVPDFSAGLNTFLASAKASGTDGFGNDYVDAKLGVKSSQNAAVILSNVSVVYDYDAIIDVAPNNMSLQKALDAMVPHKDSGSTKIVLWARAMSAGKLFFHGLHVQTDNGPTFTKIPDLTINEDTSVPHLLDLYTYFNDDNDPHDYLNYSIVSYSNPLYVNVTLNQSHYLSVDAMTQTLSHNWSGVTVVQLKCKDTRNLSKVSNKFNITVLPVDDPPVFLTRPGLNATTGAVYSYQAKAVDAEENVSYQIADGPTGMTVDAVKGLVTWTPSSVGKFDVKLRAYDTKLGTFQNFTITVFPPNTPPAITSTPVMNAKVGYTYTYQFKATDKEKDPLTAKLVQGPKAMTFNQTWFLSFIPELSNVGDNTVILEVSDGKEKTRQTFTLKVTSEGMNSVPRFTSVPDTTAWVGWAWTYPMSALDDDHDKLTFSLDSAPLGMGVRGANGTRTDWTPGASQVGSFDVVARVSDGKGYSLQAFTVNVTLDTGKVNHPPEITSTPTLTAQVGHTYSYLVKATDDDLDTITYSVDTPKARMQLDPAGGQLFWHPSSTETGNQTLTVRASDGKGFDVQTFVVKVDGGDMNGLPIFLSTPMTDAQVGVPYSYPPQAADPDGDTMTWTLGLKPDGMTVALTTGVISWTPVKGQEGNVTVEIRASDGKGFSAQRFIIKVVPGDMVQSITVTIDHPTSGQKVSGNFSISGTASVAWGKLYEVQVKIDNSAWASATGLEGWNYTINTKNLGNGDHTLLVRAWDGTTYSEPKTVHFTVSNTSPKPPPPDNTIFGFSAGICILGIVILIALIVGVVYVFTRSSAPPRVRPQPQRPYDRDPKDSYPPRDRPQDRYDREYYQDKGPGQDYGQDYDEGNGHHYDQGYDNRYQDQPQDQGYQDDKGPGGRYPGR